MEYQKITEILKKFMVKIGILIFPNLEFVRFAENTCKKRNIYTPSFRSLLLPVSKDTLEFTAVDIVISV